MAPVLKTGDLKGFASSNLAPSANKENTVRDRAETGQDPRLVPATLIHFPSRLGRGSVTPEEKESSSALLPRAEPGEGTRDSPEWVPSGF